MPRYIDATLLKAEFTGNFVDTSYSPEFIKAIIDRQPTADVQEVRHGTWRESLSDMFPDGTDYRCSVCGRTAILDSEYCPNCGAKMKRR